MWWGKEIEIFLLFFYVYLYYYWLLYGHSLSVKITVLEVFFVATYIIEINNIEVKYF